MKNEVSDITLAITTSESFETKFLLYRFVTILRSFSIHPLNCTQFLTGEFIITSWEFIVSHLPYTLDGTGLRHPVAQGLAKDPRH